LLEYKKRYLIAVTDTCTYEVLSKTKNSSYIFKYINYELDNIEI